MSPLEPSSTQSTLWEQLTSWSNLWLAYHKAAKGKRGLFPAATFDFHLADWLIALQDDLRSKRYQHGPYRHFEIYEPKRRKISASPFRDRVVHHALCNVIEPLFERRFIPDSYANRKGKGTHAAVDRLQAFTRRYRYVLRMDIVQHFPSLDHAILRHELRKVVHDGEIQWLMDHILASGAGVLAKEYRMVYFSGDDLFAVNRPRGLPIGNLTSQFWSNCYLNPFDWFVTRELGCGAYVRYVDDFALFADDKRTLARWEQAIHARLAKLRLTAHPICAMPTAQGVAWLGFVVHPTHRLVKRRNVVAFTQRFERDIRAYQRHRLPLPTLSERLVGWVNHVRPANSLGLRRHIFRQRPLHPPVQE